jgi:hypothetical protein
MTSTPRRQLLYLEGEPGNRDGAEKIICSGMGLRD